MILTLLWPSSFLTGKGICGDRGNMSTLRLTSTSDTWDPIFPCSKGPKPATRDCTSYFLGEIMGNYFPGIRAVANGLGLVSTFISVGSLRAQNRGRCVGWGLGLTLPMASKESENFKSSLIFQVIKQTHLLR